MHNRLTKEQFIDNCVNRVFGKENRFFLMGLSMIWIVLFHISYWYRQSGLGEPPWWIVLFAEGQLGVDIFFFLSAYGLEASIEKNSLMVFYRNRIRRLFPVYLLFLLIIFLTFERDCSIYRSVEQILCQVTGLSLIQYAHFFSTNFCFDWFTPAIILIYLFFPLISSLVRYAENKGFVAEIALLFVVIIVGQWIHVNKHIPLVLLSYRMPVILLGIMTFRHLKNYEIQRLAALFITALCIGFLCHEKSIILSLTVPSSLIVFSLTRFELPLKRLMFLAGRYSYEIYLAHIYFVAFFIPLGYVTDIFLLSVIIVVGTVFVAFLFSLFQKYFYKLL